MPHIQKIYTSRASLCALGCYIRQEGFLDDLSRLPLSQKKSCMLPGRNSWMRVSSSWRAAPP